MTKVFGATLLLVLAACTGVPVAPPQPQTLSACAQNEASYACQVERYNAIDTP